MGAAGAAPEVKAEARRLYEAGFTSREIGRRLGIHHATTGRWARAERWKEPDAKHAHVPTEEEVEAAQRRAIVASESLRAAWAVRRGDEATEAGKVVGILRQRVVKEVEAEKPDGPLLRSLTLAYSVFVDKAMVMSAEGGNPARGRQGDEDGPSVHGPRPTDPREMAAAGRQRALALVPSVDVASREKQA